MKRLAVFVFSAALVTASPLLAVEPAPADVQDQDYVPAIGQLVKRTDTGISYATGGVGEEELAALKAVEGQFSLKVVCSLASGGYLSDLTLRVTDAKGQPILEEKSEGPYFYATLPPGKYTVEALRPENPAQSQQVSISEKGGLKTLHFRWAGE